MIRRIIADSTKYRNEIPGKERRKKRRNEISLCPLWVWDLPRRQDLLCTK
jgi:hypothetical protein